MPIVSSFPILAMPWWGEKERALKLKIVVRVLKKRARAVLVSSMFPFTGGSRPEALDKIDAFNAAAQEKGEHNDICKIEGEIENDRGCPGHQERKHEGERTRMLSEALLVSRSR